MWVRLVLLVTTLFWGVMNVLLWRAEFGRQPQRGSSVPLENVWTKIITAPDVSALRVFYQGTNVGFCRWATTVSRDGLAIVKAQEEALPEDLTEEPTGYAVDLDGNLNLPEQSTRVGYNFTLRLHPDHAWQEFNLRLKLRPEVYDVWANDTERVLHLRFDVSAGKRERKIPFSDLRDPQKILRQLGGSSLPLMAAMMGMPLGTNQLARLSSGLRWDCRQSALMVGRSSVRAYRLSTRLLDRWAVVLYASPVGEVMRIELPGDIVLLNDALLGLAPIP